MVYTCDSCHAIFEAMAQPWACPACSARYVKRHWKVWDPEDGPVQMDSQLPAVRQASILEQQAFLRSAFATIQEIRQLGAELSSSDAIPRMRPGWAEGTKIAPTAKLYQSHAGELIPELDWLPAI